MAVDSSISSASDDDSKSKGDFSNMLGGLGGIKDDDDDEVIEEEAEEAEEADDEDDEDDEDGKGWSGFMLGRRSRLDVRFPRGSTDRAIEGGGGGGVADV